MFKYIIIVGAMAAGKVTCHYMGCYDHLKSAYLALCTWQDSCTYSGYIIHLDLQFYINNIYFEF